MCRILKRLSMLATLIAILSPAVAGADGGLAKTWDKAEIWVRTADGFFSSHMNDEILRGRLSKAGFARRST